MNKVKSFGKLIKQTFLKWKEREPFNNSILISYYTIFSLPGLLVIIINIGGYFYDEKQLTTQLTAQIQDTIGGDTAEAIESIIEKASESKETVLSSILGIATLLFGATGVFYQIQQMFNKIWEVKPMVKTKQKILELIRDRLFSFGLIIVIGFLLLVSLALSAALSAFSVWFSERMSIGLTFLFGILDIGVSLAVISFLFAAMYKFLPDAKITWKDVWPGAILTGALFVFAKFALGIYFGKSEPGSVYGAAGSIILIMLWVSYSGMIVLFGAEFTREYSASKGKKVVPSSFAASS